MAIEREPDSLSTSSRIRSASINSMSSNTASMSKHDNERTPLLRKQSSQTLGQVIELPHTTTSGSAFRPKTLLALMMVMIAIFSLGDTISDTPQKRIYESIYCYQYWEEHDPTKILIGRENVGPGAIGGVEESWCKVPTIQSQVAVLRGWQIFYDGIPSLLLAVPFGILADRIGRKPIIMLGLISYLLRITWMQFICWFWQAFPIKLVWLSALHGLISGSSPVISAVAITTISDVTDDSTRATSFLWISASNMIMYFIGPPLGAYLMTINPWIPFFLSSVIFTCCILLFSLVPETLNYSHPSLRLSARDTVSDPHPSLVAEAAEAATPDTTPAPISTSFPARLATLTRSFRTSTHFLRTDARIPLLLLPFIAMMLSLGTQEVLLQYASTRFSISYALATLYISITSGVKVLVLLILYPLAGHILTSPSSRFAFSGLRKDLTLARAAMLLACMGWVATGFTTSVPQFVAAELLVTLSYGGTSMARSFVTGIVRKDDVAKLYTLVSVVDTVAMMGGGPAMAGLWEWGVGAGEVWMGLPFWVQGVVYALVAGGMWGVRVRKGEEEEGEGEGVRGEV